MAFHLKNLKIQKDKFFMSLTAQQLCDIVQDGEIMNYVNKIPIRRTELETIFTGIAKSCDKRSGLPSGVRQKQLAPLVIQLSKIVKEYETKKVQMAAEVANAQKRQQNAAAAAAAAQANANRKAAENLQRAANAKAAEEAAAAAKAAANAQMKAAQESANLALSTVKANLAPGETSALTQELMNLRRNLNGLTARLNSAIQKSQTRIAARRRRNSNTRKSRK